MKWILRLAKRYKPVIRRIPGVLRLWRALFGVSESARLFILKRKHPEAYHEAVFTYIWKDNHWGNAESKSGRGSNLDSTATIRRELADLLSDLSVRRFLDIPCGDFHWMNEVRLPSGIQYFGGDIVEEMICQNNERFQSGSVSFAKLDILADPLPKADLVLCRDCLVHFSFSDIFKAIENLKRSGSTYLLATHFEGHQNNADIVTGRWRPVNLTKTPLNFPPPLRVIEDHGREEEQKYRNKRLALWRLEDLLELNRAE